jgi:hypothetical protein
MAFLKFISFSLSFIPYDLLMSVIKDSSLGNKTIEELIPYIPYSFEKVVVPDFTDNTSGGVPKSKGYESYNSNTLLVKVVWKRFLRRKKILKTCQGDTPRRA